MVDLDRYEDNVTLRTSEIAEWLELNPKAVRRLPIPWLSHLRTKEGRALARDVKAAYLNRGTQRPTRERGAAAGGHLRKMP